MNGLLDALRGGDRRSIRGVPEVVKRVLAEPALLRNLFAGLTHEDPLIRMRCADAIEKVTAVRPQQLAGYEREILRLASLATQKEVRWHLAQLLSRLELDARERRRALRSLNAYLADPSSIVRTFAMQALADLAGRDAALRGPILRRLQRLARTGTPAMRSRGRKLVARLREGSGR